jgi:hypothetical protein
MSQEKIPPFRVTEVEMPMKFMTLNLYMVIIKTKQRMFHCKVSKMKQRAKQVQA